MKKLLFICMVCFYTTIQTSAQLRDTTANMNMHKVDANSLLLKSKKQKTTGFILLGGGAFLEIVAIAIIIADPIGSIFNEKKANNRGLLIAGGGAVMLSSIPFFIASAKNKKKANLMLKNENVFFNQPLKIKEQFLAVAVKINL